jgi:hypothetical protein
MKTRSALVLAASLTMAGTVSRGVFAQGDSASSGPNADLFVTGLITTGVAYTPAVIVAMNSPRPEDDYLYAPFAGPWLDLANRDPNGDSKFNKTLLVVDGIVQAIGALELMASFMFVSDSSSATVEDETFTAHLVPTRMDNGGYGLSARGTF